MSGSGSKKGNKIINSSGWMRQQNKNQVVEREKNALMGRWLEQNNK